MAEERAEVVGGGGGGGRFGGGGGGGGEEPEADEAVEREIGDEVFGGKNLHGGGTRVVVVLLVMQRGWEEHVRSMCVDLIKVLKGACKNGLGLELGCYDTKTTHIKPC